MTKEQRIAVKGAVGFLGSHLCHALPADGHTVVGVDNLWTGSWAYQRHVEREPRFLVMGQDITEPIVLSKFSYLFNFASPASPADCMRLGAETLLVGSRGTINTLDLARKHSARYFHASAPECYGDPLIHLQIEAYWGQVNPIGPRSVYDKAKRFPEAAVTAYHRYCSVDTHMVRILNTYGPRLQTNDGCMILNFMMQASLCEALTTYGVGLQTRSFCYVSDLIGGIVRLARCSQHTPVNLGNHVEWTISECAREVIAVSSIEADIRVDLLPQDVRRAIVQILTLTEDCPAGNQVSPFVRASSVDLIISEPSLKSKSNNVACHSDAIAHSCSSEVTDYHKFRI